MARRCVTGPLGEISLLSHGRVGPAFTYAILRPHCINPSEFGILWRRLQPVGVSSCLR